MNINYEFDYIQIVILLLVIIISGYLVFSRQEKITTPKSIYVLIPLGFLLIVISVLFNSFYNQNWDIDYILAFLLLKDVGKKVSDTVLSQFICFNGYIIFVFGIELLIAFFRNKRRMSHKNTDNS